MKFNGNESSVLEFKREIPKNSQIVHTVIAFCNTFGGRLVLGVEDDGTICGVPERNLDAIIESLQASICQHCTPPILPFIYTQRISDKIVVIIQVSQGMQRPYLFTESGLQKSAYVRLGSHTIKADEKWLREMQWLACGLSVDSMPVYQASVRDLDEKRVHKMLKKTKRMTWEDALEQAQFIIREHHRVYPTVAGLLLCGKNPQQFLPEATIHCTQMIEEQSQVVMTRLDCHGDLLEQFHQAMAFLTQDHHGAEEKKQKRANIPLPAVREALLNAITHRHYQEMGPIKIAVFDNRIEFLSPGNFPGPLQTDQLEMGYSYVRNSVISKAFRHLGLIDKLGAGFSRIFRYYREQGLSAPRVVEGDNFIKVILPRHASTLSVNEMRDLEADVLRMFDTASEIRVKHVVSHLRVSRQTAARLFNALIEKGLVARVGQGAATRYQKKGGTNPSIESE